MMERAVGQSASAKWVKLAVQFTLGGLAGFTAAWAVDRYGWGEQVEALGASAVVCAGIGMIYLVTALFVILGLANTRVGARMLNVEDEGELLEQRRMLGLAGLGMALLGAMAVVLALSGPGGSIAAPVTLAVLVAGSAAVTAAVALQWRHMDELMRSVTQDAAVWSYYLMFVFGGGWAALAHIGYLPTPVPLDWVSLFFGLALVASFIAAGRRGLLAPR